MAVAVLVLLVAGAIGAYAWALQHWFVGVQETTGDERVAVFRGLEVSLLGLDLFEVAEVTDLAVGDLNAATRNRVRGGITADDSDDIARILAALRDQRLPPCDAVRAAPRADGTPSRTEASPSGAAPAEPGAATTSPPRPRDTTTSTPSTPARTTSSSEPGVNCRESE